MTKEPSSPHLLIGKTQAAYLVAVAQNDDKADPQAKVTLQETFNQTRHRAKVEVYPADHGWCVPGMPSYEAASAEKAWAELLALYKSSLV